MKVCVSFQNRTACDDGKTSSRIPYQFEFLKYPVTLLSNNQFVVMQFSEQGAPKFQGIFFIPPLLEPCKTVPYLNLRKVIKNPLISLEIKGFLANYVNCYSILQL